MPAPPSEAAPYSALDILGLALKDSSVVVVTFLVMFCAIGQMSAQAGLSALQTLVMTLLTVAIPAQAAAMEMVSHGAHLLAVVTVAIVNARFFVMVSSVLLQLPRGPLARQAAAVSFVSASSFAVIMPGLVGGRTGGRPVLYTGLVGGLCSASAGLGAVLGHGLIGTFPPAVSALLATMVPIYFVTFVSRQWRRPMLLANGLLGALLVPLLSPVLGGAALVIAPLAVAVLSVAGERLLRPAAPPDPSPGDTRA